jgi:phytol kinase
VNLTLLPFQSFFPNALWQDVAATLITLISALLWLRIMDTIAHWGWIDSKLSRKIIHITTGPLFLLCWPLFSTAPSARYGAMLVPLAITLQFIAIAFGWLQDPAAVQAMTRTGNPREILKGPLYYGLAFVICTIAFWRTSPVGIVALMLMCGGDGLADIIGRRFGVHKLPFSPGKSWVGSGAMFLGSWAFAVGMVVWFNTLGLFTDPMALPQIVLSVGVIAAIATLVEALPFPDIDNLTLTAAATVLGVWIF